MISYVLYSIVTTSNISLTRSLDHPYYIRTLEVTRSPPPATDDRFTNQQKKGSSILCECKRADAFKYRGHLDMRTLPAWEKGKRCTSHLIHSFPFANLTCLYSISCSYSDVYTHSHVWTTHIARLPKSWSQSIIMIITTTTFIIIDSAETLRAIIDS